MHLTFFYTTIVSNANELGIERAPSLSLAIT